MNEEEKTEEVIDPVKEKRKKTGAIVGKLLGIVTSGATAFVLNKTLNNIIPDFDQLGIVGKVVKGIAIACIAGMTGAAAEKYTNDQVMSTVELINVFSDLKNKNVSETTAEEAEAEYRADHDIKYSDKRETSFA